MNTVDWIVLIATIGFIVIYGIYKTQKQHNLEEYILGDQSSNWWKVGFAVMATQASAITFISTTGQGFSDGMRFVQFYFGLPLAMIVICISFIPIFYKLKVLTAYEFLEQRFDAKTRSFAAFIFLIQRGLAAGITLYAPSIILSSIFGWNLQWTHVVSGILVIVYTVTGGSRAVTQTQLHQLAVVFTGMLFIFWYIMNSMPDQVSFTDALTIAGWSGRMEAISFDLDFNDRYNIWSGIAGGFFLALAYFGTDQSQVQRYISGKNINESRMGLIMNGILKIPMQVFILLCGVMLFVVFQFQKTPLHFNEKVATELKIHHPDKYKEWSIRNDDIHTQILATSGDIDNLALKQTLADLNANRKQLREEIKTYVSVNMPQQESNDRDYIFLHYILYYLPHGFIGLMIAVILSAAMSSISAEMNALSGTATVDILKRHFKKFTERKSDVYWTRMMTAFWGLVVISFALYANLFENLIQFVNIIGSIFYGMVLGIFLCGFYIKYVKANAVFYAAIIAQITIILLFFFTSLGFLWYNLISCAMVIGISLLYEWIKQKSQ
jgi:solute:Na+ symporter, SSS family